jgi:hypothetical protein
MGRKIFVSYKYKDDKVAPLVTKFMSGTKTIARHYVDELQTILDYDDHINLGEKDGESLADFADSTIETSLKKKIFQSSITIVMISKGIKMSSESEKDQWIPWEISYSLREIRREDRTSRMNAVLGIVLPDENNSYAWYYTENTACNCTTQSTNKLFKILSSNMFNLKDPTTSVCNGLTIHYGEFSFIKTVKWDVFKGNRNFYLDKAVEIKENKELYDIKVNLD